MNRPNIKNIFLLLALVLVIGVAVTGCMSEGNRGLLLDSESDTATPGRPSPAPSDTSLDGQGANGANGINGGSAGAANDSGAGRFDWTADASRVEANIKRISEVSDARVVVTGDTALVGVKFDQAYQGELTERIREMVAAEVMEADPGITTVAVTADNDDVGEIYEISERSTLGKDLDTLKEDIEEIVRNATTLR